MARTKQDHRTPIDPTPLNPLPQGTAPIIRSGKSAVIYHIPTSPPTLQFTETSATPTSKTTILLPKNSTWTSGLHWHNSHTEYLRLVRGSIFVRLGSETHIISAAAGGRHDVSGGAATGGLVIKVDKGKRHNWGRAQYHLFQRYRGVPKDRMPEDIDEEVVVEEWTDPVDMQKALFFWNLNGVILGPKSTSIQQSSIQRVLKMVLGGYWISLQLFMVFWELDNFPVFFDVAAIGGWKGDSWIAKRLGWPLEAVSTYAVLFLASCVGKVVGLEAVSEGRTPDALWRALVRDNQQLDKNK